jgi:UDP-N-acetylglucosamine 2-epimerase (non-hydrolysing)
LNGKYAAVTLHRPSNVDNAEVLAGIVKVFKKIADDMPVVFPIHPRTQQRLVVIDHPGLRIISPLGYLDFLKLVSSADMVLTDSGGIQEETTILKVPCLTLRENT